MVGSLLSKMALGGGKAIWRGTTGVGGAWLRAGLGGRVAIGAGVGAVAGAGYGAFAGEGLTPEQRFRKIIGGATAGAGWGAAGAFVPAIARATGRAAGKAAVEAPFFLAKKGWALGNMAMKYPGYAVGGAAVAAGAYATYDMVQPADIASQMSSSRRMARLQKTYNTNALQYAEMQQFGVAPSPVGRVGVSHDFMNSTQGLVQGMHRGRHG